MAAAAGNPSLYSSITLPHTKLKIPLAKFTLPFTSNPHRPTTTSLRRRRPLHIINVLSNSKARKGSDVLVEALEREGVKDVFAYPRGEWMEICEALMRSPFIINVRPRNELSGIYAAEGYARASGLPGVCIATKLVWGLSGVPNAMLDCVPIVAITGGGQIPGSWMTDDAINDITPFVEEASRSITKHTYLVLNVEDIPRIVKEAFFLACSGQPGPVLISVPEDIQKQLVVPNWDQPMRLPAGSMVRLPRDSSPQEIDWEQIARLVSESRKPVLYVGGGCLNSSEELRRFVELTGIPVASTLMGLRAYPVSDDDMFLGILGMSGSVYANYAVGSSDLLLIFWVRFDEHLTGKLEAFASRAKIVHIDDSAEEIGKNNKQSHVSDVKFALKGLNKVLEGKRGKQQLKLDFSAWRKELKEHKMQHPLTFYAIQVLDELTNGNAIICSGVGQHHMWAAQLFKYDRPGKCPTSGDLRTTGFGLAVAMGAVVARPDSVVVAIDVDGSFMTSNSIHELVTIRAENLPVLDSVNTNPHSNKCKLLDWMGTGEVVAEGRWSSSDPNALVHHIPIGPNAMRVWVDVPKKFKVYYLWRNASDMTYIEEARGTTVAWPVDKVIMDSTTRSMA